MPPNFNRERFLLRLVGAIIGVQFGIYGFAALICGYGTAYTLHNFKPSEQTVVCPRIAERLQDATDSGLAILLALLGGGAIAVGEMGRRKQENAPPDDNEPGGA